MLSNMLVMILLLVWLVMHIAISLASISTCITLDWGVKITHLVVKAINQVLAWKLPEAPRTTLQILPYLRLNHQCHTSFSGIREHNSQCSREVLITSHWVTFRVFLGIMANWNLLRITAARGLMWVEAQHLSGHFIYTIPPCTGINSVLDMGAGGLMVVDHFGRMQNGCHIFSAV